MGPRQTETYYRTDTSYLKSVLLWFQEYWTGPSGAHLSAYSGSATVSALFRKEDARSNKSARRDNRSARVLATPKLVRISTAKDRPAGTETITSRLQSINGLKHGWTFFAEPSLFISQTQFHNF